MAKLDQTRNRNIYVVVQEINKSEKISIQLLCEVAEIARSSYYKWQKRKPSDLEKENGQIIQEMKKLHEKVKGIYGYRRMTMNMRKKFGKAINRKRIRRLMRVAGIESVIRKPRYRYRKSKPHTLQRIY